MSEKRRPNHYWLLDPWYNQQYVKKRKKAEQPRRTTTDNLINDGVNEVFIESGESLQTDTSSDISDDNNTINPTEVNSSFSVASESELPDLHNNELHVSNEATDQEDSQSDFSRQTSSCNASEVPSDFDNKNREGIEESVRSFLMGSNHNVALELSQKSMKI